MSLRKIKKINYAQSVLEGAGVLVKRSMSRRDVEDFDPFLLLDGFDSNNINEYIKGFPWHPHRGIETVTYLIEGEIEHGDSLGNKGTIRNGDCQWMTAGRGIIHQEMPKISDRILGVQLWINLPAKDKMTHPKYRDITSEKIPQIENNHSKIKIISGTYEDTKGAMIADYVEARILDIQLDKLSELNIETHSETTVFVYIVKGSAIFGDNDYSPVEHNNSVLFDTGENLLIKTTNQEVRLIYFEAMPLKEPIAWGGPIVMNTNEELEQAFKDLDEGTFIKD